MSNINDQDRVEMVETLSLPDNEAVRWLKENSGSEASLWRSDSDFEKNKLASFAFARRNSPRLRLAVAKYGSHIRTLRRIFKQGTKTERLAVLSNVFVGPKEEARIFSEEYVLDASDAMRILRNFRSNQRELAVFANNPNIERDWLADIIKGWEKVNGLENEGLLHLVHFLSGNPIISSQRDDTVMDGSAEHSYQRLNLALVDLLQKVPVDLNWANVLSGMLDKLYLPFVPDFEVNLLKRWKDPEPTKDGERFYFPFLREQITKYLIIPNHRHDAKKGITVEHPDSAVRKGLYSSLPPYELFEGISRGRDFSYPSFRFLGEIELTESQQAIVDFCKKCFERDKNDFVESLIQNVHFWKSKEEREFLSDISWSLAEDPHSMMDVPNNYRATERFYVEKYPSFFEDDDLVDMPYQDTVEGKLSQLQSEVNKLRVAIESQSLEDLAEEQRSHFELIIEQTQNQIRRLSDDLSDKTDELAKTIERGSLGSQLKALEARVKRQSGLLWLLIIALGVIAYLNST